MERLKAELLAAELNLETINREADVCLKWMRDEIAALDAESKAHAVPVRGGVRIKLPHACPP